MMGCHSDNFGAKIRSPLLAIMLFSILLLAGCPQDNRVPPAQEDDGEVEYVQPEPEPGPEPLVTKVGFIGPLTGENASLGQEALNALRLAASELSDNLYSYEIIEQDGKCSYTNAAEALEYLVDFRGVGAVIGGLCPDEVDGMAASLEERSAILISLSKGTMDNGQVMSFAPPEGSSADALASLCASRGMKRVLVVSDGSAAALAKKSLFESSARKAGLSVLPAQVCASDFSSAALLIRGYNPEAIIVTAQDSSNAAKVVNTLRSYGISAKIAGDSLLITYEALSAMGDNSEGIYSLDSGPDYMEGRLAYFLNEYSFAYGEPHDAELVVNAANALYLLAQAQDFYSYRATPQDFRNYWISLDSWEGFGGALFFEHGDRTSPFREVTVSGGSVEILS